MPNHCTNEVSLCCDSGEEAKRLAQWLKGEETPFDFNKIIPCPQELLEPLEGEDEREALKAQYGHESWYGWRLEHWGTKWNSYECELDDSWITEGQLAYRFDTAWGPPEGIHKRLLEFLKEENLEVGVSWFYHEPMMQLTGYL